MPVSFSFAIDPTESAANPCKSRRRAIKAVFRLNLIVSAVFALALAVTLYVMLQQAARDIEREVGAGIKATQEIMAAASFQPEILELLVLSDPRHVELEIIGGMEQLQARLNEPRRNEAEVPAWFGSLIPGLDELDRRQQVRFLNDGRAARLRANTADELAEVWESLGNVVMLFLVSALLSNLAIYLGVRQGIRPVAHFLAALKAVQNGDYGARLQPYAIGELNQLADHFNRMAGAVEQAEHENHQLSKTLMEVREQERAHLARELHDDLGQYLTGIQAQLYLVRAAPEKADKVAQAAAQISANCEAMQKSFRRLVRDLHPVILQQLGLAEALRAYLDDWSATNRIKVDATLPADLPPLPDDYTTHLYRIVQEALNNVARHAGATRVIVRFRWQGNSLSMDLCDNGQGLQQPGGDGMGIRSMQERARCLGGSLTVAPGSRGGVCVRLRGVCQPDA